jgi:hypothetical protein
VIKSHQFLLEGCLPCWRGAYYTPLDHAYIRSASTRASLLPFLNFQHGGGVAPGRTRHCISSSFPRCWGKPSFRPKAPDIPGNTFPSKVMDGRVLFIHSACFLFPPTRVAPHTTPLQSLSVGGPFISFLPSSLPQPQPICSSNGPSHSFLSLHQREKDQERATWRARGDGYRANQYAHPKSFRRLRSQHGTPPKAGYPAWGNYRRPSRGCSRWCSRRRCDRQSCPR